MSQGNAQRILKNSIYMFIRMAVVLVLGLITSRLVLQALGFDDYGTYNVVNSVVLFLTFLQNALTIATSRHITYDLGIGDELRLRKSYSISIIAHLVLAAILVLILETAGIWFINNYLNVPEGRMTAVNWCFQFCIWSMVIHLVSIPFISSIVAYEHMNYYALVSIIEAALKLGIAVLLLVSSSDRLILYASLTLVMTILVRLMYYLYCRRRLSGCRFTRDFDADQVKQFVKFSGWSVLVNSTDGISLHCRNIFLNWFCGVLANAAMGVATQVFNVLNGFSGSFTQAIKPHIIKTYASGDRQYLFRLIYSSTKILFFIFVIISLPVLLNLEFLLDLWLKEYPPLTIPFVQAIIFYLFFDVTQQALSTTVYATGNIKIHEIVIASIKVWIIPITYFTLKWGYSPVLPMFIWAFLNFLCAIARTFISHSLFGLPLGTFARKVILPLLAVSVLSFILPWWLSSVITQPWLKLVVTTFLSILLVSLSGFFIGMDKDERTIVLQFIPLPKVLKKHIERP